AAAPPPAPPRPGLPRLARRGRPPHGADPGVAVAAADPRHPGGPLPDRTAHWRWTVSIRGRTVVVVGGGVGGLATGLLFARAGRGHRAGARRAARGGRAGLVLQPNNLTQPLTRTGSGTHSVMDTAPRSAGSWLLGAEVSKAGPAVEPVAGGTGAPGECNEVGGKFQRCARGIGVARELFDLGPASGQLG